MKILAVVLAAVAVLVGGAPSVTAQAPGTREVILQGDWGRPPAETIEELLDRSSLVVAATIVSERPADDVTRSDDGTESTTVLTAFEVGESEWIKTPTAGTPPQRVELLLRGGIRVEGDEIVHYRDSQFPKPHIGDRFLLFLAPSLGGWEPAVLGAESAFRIVNGRLVPVGRLALSKRVEGQDASAVIAHLRRTAQ